MKKIKYIYFTFVLLLMSVSIAYAKSYTLAQEGDTNCTTCVNNSDYVIGTHLFTDAYIQKHDFSTQMIMYAASSLDGSSLDNIKMYWYFGANEMMDVITYDIITMSPETTYEITHVDGVCIDETCNGTNVTVTFDETNAGDDFIPDASEGCEGDACDPKVLVPHGGKLTADKLPTVRKRVGYEFAYWTLKGEDEAFDFSIPIVGNITLEPAWKAIAYTIKYDSNGGVGSVNNTTCDYSLATSTTNCKFADAAGLTRENYDFVGWSTSKSNNLNDNYYQSGNDLSLILDDKKEVTLYAVWKAVEYDITYHYENALVANKGVLPSTYTVLDEMILVPALEKVGYTFVGWYSDPEFNDALEIDEVSGKHIAPNKKSNYDLYAKFDANKFSLKYSDEEPIVCTYDSETDCEITFTPELRNGFKFSHWYTFDDKGNEKAIPLTNDKYIVNNYSSKNNDVINLYAKLNTIDYSISYEMNGGEIVSGSLVNSYSVNNPQIIIPVLSKKGYTFGGWYYDNRYENPVSKPENNYIVSDKYENLTLYAKFTANQFKFTYKGQTLTCTYDDEENCEVEFTPQLREGYKFDGWYVDENRVIPSIDGKYIVNNFTVEANKTFELKVNESPIDYKITYDLDGGNINTHYKDTFNALNMSVTLMPPVKEGYKFDGYKVIYQGEEGFNIAKSTEVEMTKLKNVTLEAQWKVNVYTVKYGVDNHLQPETEEDCSVEEPCKITINNPSLEKRDFIGWNIDGFIYNKGDEISLNGEKTEYVAEAIFSSADDINITYILDGHSWGVNNTPVTTKPFGSEITSENLTQPDESANPYYSFAGWYTSPNGGGKVNISKATEDITVYGKWYPIEYTVSFYNVGELLGTQTCTYGSDCVIDDYSGYIETSELIGWSFEDNGILFYGPNAVSKYFCEESGSSNIKACSLSAVTKHFYSIYYDLNGGDAGVAVLPEEVEAGYTVELPALEKEGYTFNGWEVTSDNATVSATPNRDGKYTLTHTQIGNVKVRAKFTAVTYNVTYKNGNETLDTLECTYDSPCATLASSDELITEELLGWSIEDDGKLFYGLDMQSGNLCEYATTKNGYDCTLYAVTNDVFAVNYDLNDGEINPLEEVVLVKHLKYGEVIKIPSLVKDNYAFTGWSVSDNATITKIENSTLYELKLNKPGDVSLYANFSEGVNINFDLNGGSFVNPGISDTQIYAFSGTIPKEVSLPNAYREGYTFLGWLVGDASSGEFEDFHTVYELKTASMNENIPPRSFVLDGSSVIKGLGGTRYDNGTECYKDICYYLIETDSITDDGDYYIIENLEYRKVVKDNGDNYLYGDIYGGKDSYVLFSSSEGITFEALWRDNLFNISYEYDGNDVTDEFVAAGFPDMFAGSEVGILIPNTLPQGYDDVGYWTTDKNLDSSYSSGGIVFKTTDSDVTFRFVLGNPPPESLY